MRILRLRPEEKEYFECLDPFGYLDRLSLPHYFALVAVIDGENGAGHIGGLVVAGLYLDRIVIEWLCVDPDKHNQGIGTAMVKKIFELAQKQELSYVSVRFVMEDELEDLSEGAGYFFTEFFEKEEELAGEWIAECGRLLSGEYFRQDPDRLPKAVSLSTMRSGFLEKAIPELWGSIDAVSISDEPGAVRDYDPELSSVLLDEGDVCGLFLVQKTADAVYPSFLYSESRQETQSLLLCAADEARKQLPPDTAVRLIPNGKKSERLGKEVFGGDGYESWFMTAELSYE